MMRRIVLVISLFFSVVASSTTVNQLIVFGDSLSDNGNLYQYMKHQLPMSPPYYKGRFSNGPVWAELLVQSAFPEEAEKHLLDYAVGGAGVTNDDDNLFSLRKQIDSYLLTHNDKVNPSALVVVWIGSNNYLAIPDAEDEAVQSVTSGIDHELRRLADHGAKYILLANVPNLGQTPVAREFDEVELLTRFSKKNNDLLDQRLGELKRDYPGIKWLSFDVYAAMEDMIQSPANFGFTNVTSTCYEAAEQELEKPTLRRNTMLSVAASVQRQQLNLRAGHACDGYLFFDLVHPTGHAHAVMAKKTEVMLEHADIHLQ